MDPFLRRLSFLMVLLVLAGCGQGRADAPTGRPYPVTLEQGVLPVPVAVHPSGQAGSSSQSSCSGSWFGSCDLKCGSGKDALVGIVVVVAVVIVVAVVVLAVDAATAPSESVAVSYYLTLSGEGVPLDVVTISEANHIYLDDQQHATLVRGAYTRAVIRAAAWEGTKGAPTQEVRVSVQRGRITIAPADLPMSTMP
jgi:hypothetical protein